MVFKIFTKSLFHALGIFSLTLISEFIHFPRIVIVDSREWKRIFNLKFFKSFFAKVYDGRAGIKFGFTNIYAM